MTDPPPTSGSLFNFWMGVTLAGYPVSEELPICLLVYLVPGALAGIVWWRLASRA